MLLPELLNIMAEYASGSYYIDWKDDKIFVDGPSTIELIEQIQKTNPDEIDWENLSRNPAALPSLEKNLDHKVLKDKIDWGWLSTNPAALPLLKKNPDKIDWYLLSENPAAIPLLEKNLNKIYWDGLSRNPAAIFFVGKKS